jgi:serine O-acetyltransferase
MIQSRQDYLLYLREDARRAGISSLLVYWAKLIYGNEQAHSLKYLKSLRKYEYYTNCKHRTRSLWYRYRQSRLGLRYGIHIGINMVGYGFWIPHFTGGVIINCKSMGNYCSVNGGVVVGNRNSQNNVPIFGNDVKLSIGVKVYGKIKIGDNVIIAPNSVIFDDVPSNVAVSSVNKYTIVKPIKKSLNKYYYEND